MLNKKIEDKIVRAVLAEWHMHPVTCEIEENFYGRGDSYYDVHMILKYKSDVFESSDKENNGKFFQICAEVFPSKDGSYFATDTHRVSNYYIKEEWKEKGVEW